MNSLEERMAELEKIVAEIQAGELGWKPVWNGTSGGRNWSGGAARRWERPSGSWSGSSGSRGKRLTMNERAGDKP